MSNIASENTVMQKLWQLKDWVASKVPESVKSTVSSNFKSLSGVVSGVVSGVYSAVKPVSEPTAEPQVNQSEPTGKPQVNQSEPTGEPQVNQSEPTGEPQTYSVVPKEIETALKGTTKTFRIKGGSSGYKTYLKDIIKLSHCWKNNLNH